MTLIGHHSRFYSITFSHDSTYLASASLDSKVKIWVVNTATCLHTLEDAGRTVVFSHDSAWLAISSEDDTIKIWDTITDICIRTLHGHGGTVRSVATSNDSSRIVSVAQDDLAKIWDTSSGKCLQTLEICKRYPWSAIFLRDSARVATSSGHDGTIQIWDVSSGAYLKPLQCNTRDAEPRLSFYYHSGWLRRHFENGEVELLDVNIEPSNKEGTQRKASLLKAVQDGVSSPIEITAKGAWLTYMSDNVLWVPSEYRPACSATSENLVGLGTASGKVWICSFQGGL